MLTNLKRFFGRKSFGGDKHLADEFSRIVNRNPFGKILDDQIKRGGNAIYAVLLYIKHGFGDFERTLVKLLAPLRLFGFGKIFLAENVAVKSEREKNRGNMKARNAQKMRVERVNLTEFAHFLVFRSVGCGQSEMINLPATLIKAAESEHPLFCEAARVPKSEFFDEHCKWSYPKIDEIEVNPDF